MALPVMAPGHRQLGGWPSCASRTGQIGARMTTPVCPSYAGYRFPAEIISHAVWLYFRFPVSLRNVDEILAARSYAGIWVTP